MKLKGGYNVILQGRPAASVNKLPNPDKLFLPLKSCRFNFSEICVKQGQHVDDGAILAKDPDNYGVPLLAPSPGTVSLGQAEGHIVLSDITAIKEHIDIDLEELAHIEPKLGSAGIKRYQLLSLGAWQFFYDAYTGRLPDPLGTPQAIIVSTLSLEPFVARGDVQLHRRLLQFTRGLEHLQSLLEYQPIYLVMPDISSSFASQVRNQIRGYAWIKLVEIPLKYPYDNFNILARGLGLKKDAGPIWSVRAEGVLAIDRALTLLKACLDRIVSIGGPGAKSRFHLRTVTGYPKEKILEACVSSPDARVLSGGMLTGEPFDSESLGLDTECRGLTVLLEHKEREFLGFARIGWGRHSYANCFLSAVRKDFSSPLTTAVYGEGRPCISCNFCEEVCPAGIMPYLIHKYLYCDLLEEAEAARVDLCVECGLCSFVCPSKIELRNQFIETKELIKKEKEEIRQEQLRQERIQQQEEERRKSIEENSQ